MTHDEPVARGGQPVDLLAQRYESVLCVFLIALAFLWRDNPELQFPRVLYLLAALLVLNLAAGSSLRLWPTRKWLSAAITLSNCAVITGILSASGGPESKFWVLYLLPIYTSSLLLGSRETAWITGGAVAFNAAFSAASTPVWDLALLCSLALKSALLAFSAAVTCRIVGKEKESLRRLDIQRRRLRRLERTDRDRTHQAARNEGLAQVGLESSELLHDLRNPLTVILGTASLLLESEGFPEALREDLLSIERSAQYCKRLAGGVLKAARQTGEQGVFDLADVVDNALVLYEKKLARRIIQVECRSPHGNLVRADAVEIQRVFMNLFANAADAMPRGGVLRVDLSREGGSVRAAVEDTGPGIDAKTLSTLFQAFATTKGDKGTGLGLYLSREIARRHGGELSVENAPGGGARFLLSLPVLAEAPALPVRLT